MEKRREDPNQNDKETDINQKETIAFLRIRFHQGHLGERKDEGPTRMLI